MNPVLVLEKLTNMEYQDLIAKCKEEISFSAQKSIGNGDRFKAVLAFAKQCKKEYENSKVALAGATNYEDNGVQKQSICNGYVGVILNNQFNGLPMADDSNSRFKLEDVIPKYDTSCEHIKLPTIENLKATLKILKAEHKGEKGYIPTIEIENRIFNINYLIYMIGCLDATDGWFTKSGNTSPLCAENENGIGIVLPIRTPQQVDNMIEKMGEQSLFYYEMEGKNNETYR